MRIALGTKRMSSVGKHAQATRALVILSVADDIVLEVADRGVGFDPAAIGKFEAMFIGE